MIGPPPHVPECPRTAWLLEQRASRPFREVFVDALLMRGPECRCPVTGEPSVQS